jgi:GT2 family glycosyltransferase
MEILRLAGQRAEAEGSAMDAQIRLGESKLRLDQLWVEKEQYRTQLMAAEHRNDLTAEESPVRSSFEVSLFADARRILLGLRRHYSGETQSLAPSGRAFGDDCGRSVLASVLARQDRVAFPKVSRPKVSVIVVLRNKAHLSILCLCSLLLATAVDYELIIVDNDSSDETADVLRLVDSATVIRHRENLGFGPTVAEVASRASGEFLCLLNNDMLLQQRSLASLLGVFAERPDAGAVGGMIRLADGRLQEAGCIVWRDGTVRQWGRGCDPHLPKYCFRRPVDYCSAACLVTPRLLFQAVGGLDDRYAPAYYEDVDYCMKLWNVARPVFYEPRSVVHHYESASSPSLLGTREMILVNHRRFVDRWRTKLDAHQMDGPKTITRARFAAQSGSPSCLYFLGKLPERLSDWFLDPRLQRIRSRVRDRNLIICIHMGEDGDPQLRSSFPIDVELRGLNSMEIDEVDDYCHASDMIVVAAAQHVSSGIGSILEKYSTKVLRD